MTHSRALAIVAASLSLLACSTSKEVTMVAVPPPEFQRDLPLEPPAPGTGRVCKLGESCLTMDTRPFEACLVDTRHCVDKAVESIPVKSPDDARQTPRSIRVRE